jgi:hypothetical protein
VSFVGLHVTRFPAAAPQFTTTQTAKQQNSKTNTKDTEEKSERGRKERKYRLAVDGLI